jgi:hypothetical protein
MNWGGVYLNELLIHLNETQCVYRPYSLVPDPQISRNCEAFAIPRWKERAKKILLFIMNR